MGSHSLTGNSPLPSLPTLPLPRFGRRCPYRHALLHPSLPCPHYPFSLPLSAAPPPASSLSPRRLLSLPIAASLVALVPCCGCPLLLPSLPRLSVPPTELQPQRDCGWPRVGRICRRRGRIRRWLFSGQLVNRASVHRRVVSPPPPAPRALLIAAPARRGRPGVGREDCNWVDQPADDPSRGSPGC